MSTVLNQIETYEVYILQKTNVQQFFCFRSYLVKHEEAGCGMNSTTDLNDEDVDDRS